MSSYSVGTCCITEMIYCSSYSPREPHCVALHSFSAEGPNELSISPGDVVLLVGREGDWFKGRVGGKEGIFPSSFVEVKVDLPPQQQQAKTECELTNLCKLEA